MGTSSNQTGSSDIRQFVQWGKYRQPAATAQVFSDSYIANRRGRLKCLLYNVKELSLDSGAATLKFYLEGIEIHSVDITYSDGLGLTEIPLDVVVNKGDQLQTTITTTGATGNITVYWHYGLV